jgi:hypothetical protein
VTAVDLANGLDVGREAVFSTPADVPHWSENLLFAMYDAANDVGLWLHLGTIPNRWHLWEDRILVTLPGEAGVLTSRSYRKTPPNERPAGANLSFNCREPYSRWHVTAEAMAVRTAHAQMRSGLVQDGPKDHVGLDLDVTCRTPVWDMHAMTQHGNGRGSMQSQSWATEHYEQLYTVTGSVSLPTGAIEFNGTGWRDHSRGPRGGETGAPWGGHVILGAYFPRTDRGVGLCRYYHPYGGVTLEGAYVSQAGVMNPAVVLDASRITELRKDGESLRFGLQSPGAGETWLDATTTTSIWTMLKRSVHYYGIDPTGELGSVYVVNFATVEWDGEPGSLYVERSAAPGVRLTTPGQD